MHKLVGGRFGGEQLGVVNQTKELIKLILIVVDDGDTSSLIEVA